MNVACPQCATVFRVDPAKVPERGVRARCSVCGALIPVRRPAVAPPAIPSGLLAAAPTPVPVPPPAMPAPVVEPPPAPAGPRFTNPFLQQDPTTRARRLARALISDLVVYHPEKRARGLAEGTLQELFGAEIRKSWEEYVEQVGEDLAKTTPHFTEALNEILAEGRALFS